MRCFLTAAPIFANRQQRKPRQCAKLPRSLRGSPVVKKEIAVRGNGLPDSLKNLLFSLSRKMSAAEKTEFKSRLLEFQIGRFGWLVDLPGRIFLAYDLKMLRLSTNRQVECALVCAALREAVPQHPPHAYQPS